jgi:hypothetical protein
MKKVIFAIVSTMLLTSCVEDVAKKLKSLLGEATADTSAVVNMVDDNDTKQQQEETEDIKDLPLLAAAGFDEADWYAPVGFTPSKQLSGDEYAALTEEQQEAENQRGLAEVDAFVSMLKQNKERYNKLLVDGTWKDVTFVEANFDRGESSTFAMGWKGEERKDHMKYVRYRVSGGKNNGQFNFGMLFTKEYVDSHNFQKVTNKSVAMPKDVFDKIEQRTGKKIAKVPYGYAIGSDYKYFVVMFVNEGNKAYAIHAVTTPEGLALSEMESTDVDESGEAMWAVDSEGEYPMMDILIAEKAGAVLKIWYTDLAPEHACLGAFIVKGDKMQKRDYSENYIWVN